MKKTEIQEQLIEIPEFLKNTSFKSQYIIDDAYSAKLDATFKQLVWDMGLCFSEYDNAMMLFAINNKKISQSDIIKFITNLTTDEIKIAIDRYQDNIINAKLQLTNYMTLPPPYELASKEHILESLLITDEDKKSQQVIDEPYHKVRNLKINEDGSVTITCGRHYYKDCCYTAKQYDYFRKLGGRLTGWTTSNHLRKTVTKRDMSTAIEYLKKGKIVTINVV